MTTATAVFVSTPGGPEVLQVREHDVPAPGAGEVQVEVAAAGVNFIDVYKRAGVYPTATPFVGGEEGAGTVTAVGEGVTEFAVGDRVAWGQNLGSASTLVNVPEAVLVPVPDGVELETAAAAMLQGMTAHYLSHSTYQPHPGEVALVHAAAGGVGQLLVQMLVAAGVIVVAVAGSEEKLEIARRRGATHTVNSSTTDRLDVAVRDLVGGGVDVVFDGVGAATFDVSLASLRPRGLMVLFGGASGQVPPFDLQRLNKGGSLFITRPTMGHYLLTREELLMRGTEVLGAIADGTLDVQVGGRYPFSRAADAYAALEGRATVGKVILVPDPAA